MHTLFNTFNSKAIFGLLPLCTKSVIFGKVLFISFNLSKFYSYYPNDKILFIYSDPKKFKPFLKNIVSGSAALKSWLRDFLSSCLRRLKTRKALGGPKELSTDISALCPLQDLGEAYLPPALNH